MALSSWRHSSHGNHGGSYFRQLGSKTGCSAKKTAIYFALQCASVSATHWHAKRYGDHSLPSWDYSYAVWGGSRCVGVFFARWGVIFAGDGMPGRPRGPSSSCWMSSSVLRRRPSSSWRGGPNTSIVTLSLSRLSRRPSGWHKPQDDDF